MIKRISYFLLALAISLVLPAVSLHARGEFVVVIDAGHGGHDPGAIGRVAREKDINLRTALELGRLISNNCRDVKVIFTRKTDVFVNLERRAQIANNAKADLFISIHTNALPKGKIIRGAETYTLGMARANENLEVAKKENSVILMENDYKATYKGFNPNSSESYIIFEFMQDKNMNQSVNFAKKIQSQFRNTGGRNDRGVHQAGFLVLRETSMPSVLVELGYISTPDEENFLSSSEGAARMAKCIFNAFNAYKNGNKAESEPTMATAVDAPSNDTPLVAESLADDNAYTAAPKDTEQPPVQVVQQPAMPNEAARTTATVQDKRPVFKIQILTASNQLRANDARFKGLKPVEWYREGGLYKYTYGTSTNYNEVLKTKKEINGKFADCFIIAFLNDEKMNTAEAIRLFKNRKK